MAIKVGSREIVKEIIKHGADPNGGKGFRNPIDVACIHGQWQILDTLLECDGIDVNSCSDPPLCLIVKKLGEPSSTSNCDYQRCFDILVQHPKIDINQKDNSGSTALHYAVRYKEEKATRALLDKNTYIGTRNRFQDLPITDINPSILEEYFDSRITTNGKRAGDEELEIYFDYSCLFPPDVCKTSEKFCEEMVPIYEMTKSTDLRHLLKHPLISSLPHLSISTHMVMLRTVSITFMRSLMLYSILLIAFALCFYTLLGGTDNPNAQVEDGFNKFIDPGTAIIKTIVMMTGEFEAANIEFKSNTLSYVFFLLFVFFMSVVLFNLLNGLAVSDTQAIKAEAELTGFITRAQVLERYEKLVFGKNTRTVVSSYLRRNRIYNHSNTSKLMRNDIGTSGEANDLLRTSGPCCFGCEKCTSLDGKIVR
uniref:Ion transport domain-containing protein n=1 Tax=Lutzomyia longipalpis TaxID=7200 RepID=A0A1B0GJQ5_LUTLO